MVAARETTLGELLGGPKQYQVPLYQRTYSWGKPQLEQLWEDILQLAEDRAESPNATHFIGSLVLAPSPGNGPVGVQRFLVVDGQQRLTTLSLLLCALRDDHARREPSQRDRFDDLYLVNRYHPDSHLKVLPTQADQPSYLACVDASPQAGGTDQIGEAYRLFAARLDALNDPEVASKIEDAVVAGLAIVVVNAGRDDNVYRIFESLNNTGLKLTQADLLRNYLFMRLPTRGEIAYRSLWLPLQQSFSSDELEQLFWLDLVQSDPRVNRTDVYARQQQRLERLRTEAEIETEVTRFSRLGVLFQLILDPSLEADPEVRRRLARLASWGSSTANPVLLRLLFLRSEGKATSEEIARAMLYLESFFVRRIVIGRATANLNRILAALASEMDPDKPADEAIHEQLSTGRKFYATDDEIKTAVEDAVLPQRPRQPAQADLVVAGRVVWEQGAREVGQAHN